MHNQIVLNKAESLAESNNKKYDAATILTIHTTALKQASNVMSVAKR